jgi:transposase
MGAGRDGHPRAPRRGGGAEKRGPDAGREPTDHALGRSVGGFSTKIHLLSDSNGLPLDARLTPGQRHESTEAEAVLEQVRLPRHRPRARRRAKRLAADRGFDARRIRQWLRNHGMQPVIPPRKRTGKPKRGRPCIYNKDHYRRRSTVEQCVGWLKECRAIATRYEKLALNYLGLLKLAFIERYLRLLAPPPPKGIS